MRIRQTGYVPLSIFLGVLLTLGLSMGCGGNGAHAPAAKPAPPAAEKPPVGPDLDLPSLRAVMEGKGKAVSSDATNRFHLGSDFIGGTGLSQRVTAQGTSVLLEPDWDPGGTHTTIGLAYCFYAFHPQPYSGDPVVCLNWISPPVAPTQVWVGVSYFPWDSWYWFQPDAENKVNLGWLDYFRNDLGNSYVAVIVPGLTSCELGWVRFGSNVPPEVSLVPSASSGLAPLSVTFDAGASSDVDGAIAKYEWDYDGNTVFDQDTGTTPTGSHTYNNSGVFQATLRVTDNEGGVSVRATPITVQAGDQEPGAVLMADITFAKSPLDVNLDASASYEVGGSITKYEWDLDGDGAYEEDGGAEPKKFVAFNAPGPHTVGVRVTDDDGQTATDTLALEVDEAGYDEVENNEGAVEADPPGNQANALPLYGFNDFEANLGDGGYDGDNTDWYSLELKTGYKYTLVMDQFVHASADLDMTLYQSDGTTEAGYSRGVGNSETIAYAPDADGTFYLKCYVFSPAAGKMSNYELNLSNDEVVLPVASFTMVPNAGPRVLTVNLDASASNAPGGSIAKYEWDFNGDGLYDLTKNAGDADEALATAVYYALGSFDATLRVTSDSGGVKATKQTVTVTGAPDSESEPNNDADSLNTPDDAAAANAWPSFPFQNYFGRVGPKAVTGNPGDPDDWYEFTVSSAGTVDILMNLFDAVCDIDMKLYAEGDYTSYIGSSTGVDDDEQITVALTPGTYYLQVYAYTGAPALGGYKLTASYGP